jgi:hypothetical protein
LYFARGDRDVSGITKQGADGNAPHSPGARDGAGSHHLPARDSEEAGEHQRASKIALEPRPQKSTAGCPRLRSTTGLSRANFRGGPGALVLDRKISALTGKNIDKLSGSHELDSIEIR